MQNFRELGAPPPDPRASGGWGLRPQTPKTALPLRISGYAPALSFSVLCANSTHKYPKCFFEYYLHMPQYTSARAVFSSCTYQKQKHEINGKSKMI